MGILSKFIRKKEKKEDPRIASFFRLGILAFQQKDFKRSEKFFKQVLKIAPDHEDAKYNLKIVLMKEAKEAKKRIEERKKQRLNQSKQPTVQKEGLGASFKPPILVEEEKPRGEDDKLFYYRKFRLDSDATQDEIRDRLNKDFKKWRTRINSPDLKKRYEAEEMLNLISRAKRVLLQK